MKKIFIILWIILSLGIQIGLKILASQQPDSAGLPVCSDVNEKCIEAIQSIIQEHAKTTSFYDLLANIWSVLAAVLTLFFSIWVWVKWQMKVSAVVLGIYSIYLFGALILFGLLMMLFSKNPVAH